MDKKRLAVVSSLLLTAALLAGQVAAPVVAVTSTAGGTSQTSQETKQSAVNAQADASQVAGSDVSTSTTSPQATANATAGNTKTTPAQTTQAAVANTQTVSVIKTITGQQSATLAPGITEQRLTYLNKNDAQTKYYSVSLDPKNSNTQLVAGTPNDSTGTGLQTVRDQANAAIIHGQQVVAAVNADFFNMANGTPNGNVVKNGTEVHAATGSDEAFFGIKKDGTPVIGSAQTYSQVKAI